MTQKKVSSNSSSVLVRGGGATSQLRFAQVEQNNLSGTQCSRNLRTSTCICANLNNKKSQVTIFLILGILVLIVGSLFFLNKEKFFAEKTEQEVSLVNEQVPVEFEPIKAYVENCLLDTSINGLTIIGQQGGYIDFKRFNLRSNKDPTASDLVRFSPGSDLEVPYWYYLESDNKCEEKCKFRYGRPYLFRTEGEPSIEQQLDMYVQNNIDQCLNNFNIFRDQGYDFEFLKRPKATTTVTENDVIFSLEYPIEAKRESTKKISNYFVRIPINLKRMYEQASILTNLEAEYSYIEKDTLNLIFAYSDIDAEKLPPFSDYDFEFGDGIKWNKQDVKNDVQSILTTYIQFMQVFGSANYAPYDFPSGSFEDALYNAGMLVVDNETSDEISFFFNYLDFWPIYFDMNCDGDTCRAESVSIEFIPIIGIQKYEFLYDVSFPVLVEMRDDAALNNRGFEFRFFLEANIRNNEPLKPDFVQLEMPNFNEQSLLCNENNRHSGLITINTKDSYGTELVGADVIFSCADQGCSIGKTQNGSLKEKFPVCLGGILTIIKENYVGESRLLTTKVDEEKTVDIQLEPIKTLNFKIKKYSALKDNGWNIISNPINLDAEESAIITLERIGSITEKSYSTFGILEKGQQKSTIDIAPGNYQLDIQLKNDKVFVVPKEEKKEGVFPFEKKFEIPEIKLNESFIGGGAKINISITPEDLKKNTVTFFVISPDLLAIPSSERTYEDIDQLNNIEKYSENYASQLKPVFEDE